MVGAATGTSAASTTVAREAAAEVPFASVWSVEDEDFEELAGAGDPEPEFGSEFELSAAEPDEDEAVGSGRR